MTFLLFLLLLYPQSGAPMHVDNKAQPASQNAATAVKNKPSSDGVALKESKEPISEQHQTKPEQSRNLSADDNEKWVRWGVYINGALALATFILAVYAVKQANAAKISALASKASADAVVNSERAWLLLGDFTEERQNYRPEGINLYLTFKNYGKTPAWVVEHCFHFVRIPKRTYTLEPFEPYDPQIIPFGEPVPPDKPYPRICAQLELDEEIVGRPDLPSDFIFYGYIKYQDVFYPTTRQMRVTHVRKRFERTQDDVIQDRPGRWVDDGPPEANWCQ